MPNGGLVQIKRPSGTTASGLPAASHGLLLTAQFSNRTIASTPAAVAFVLDAAITPPSRSLPITALFPISIDRASAFDTSCLHSHSSARLEPAKGCGSSRPGGNPAAIDAPSIAIVPDPQHGSNKCENGRSLPSRFLHPDPYNIAYARSSRRGDFPPQPGCRYPRRCSGCSDVSTDICAKSFFNLTTSLIGDLSASFPGLFFALFLPDPSAVHIPLSTRSAIPLV
mmetsp:Transcript_17800/g.50955  ORF Transcript_17800/g.50955 Transcript_17800/m.50955 type:complete len:225 (-) Transcript_17800:683-1357(-)